MRAIKITLVLTLALIFGLTTVTAMAADKKTSKKTTTKVEKKVSKKKADKWCLIRYEQKDKKTGKKTTVCKVISCTKKTEKTVAGPFKTKNEAVKAKEKMCKTKK